MRKFPHYKQLDAMDCGPTCLRMVAKYYGKSYSLQYLRNRSYISREWVSMLGISEAAENIGFRPTTFGWLLAGRIHVCNHYVSFVPEKNYKGVP